MSAQNSLRQQSRKMAFCGLMTALGATVMLLGGLIPLTTFACPMLAIIAMLPIDLEYGPKMALVAYAAVALVVLMAAPDKELAMFFAALGYYPALRPALERIKSRIMQILAKCAVFSAAMVIMYALLIYLFRLEALIEEFSEFNAAILLGFLVLGNFTFICFDRALGLLAILYERRIRKRIFR